jgi:exodeoxyribonuclease VII large subunit
MSQLSFLDQLNTPRKALSVSELTSQIKDLVEGNFFDLWVEGEISNYRRHTSGHWYFSLKDEFASIRCACFRMQNRLIRFKPEDGLNIRARGRLSVYEVRGDYQMVIEWMEPVGAGAMQLAFEQLKARLAAEGLFETGRKRPLPLLPRSVGVVTSPTGAAVRDILRIIRRRNEKLSVLIAPARVQGDGAAQEVARAIAMLNTRGDVDVIIVGRGGGSTEDLWAFNEECVARAIHKSRAPVISAVGHEADFTIADFVADFRASTPSAAAELVTKARDEIEARITGLTDRAAAAVRLRLLENRRHVTELTSRRAFREVSARARTATQSLDDAAYRMEIGVARAIKTRLAGLEYVTARLRHLDPRRVMAERRGNLDLLTSRLESSLRAASGRARERFAVKAGKLQSLSPLAVLGRGYAIAFDHEGRVIIRAEQVASGERVTVRVAEGELDCTRN